MQTRVNARTAMYGKHYSGEQLPKATNEREKARYEGITRELKDLAGRQERLAKVTKEVGKTEDQDRQLIPAEVMQMLASVGPGSQPPGAQAMDAKPPPGMGIPA